MTITRRKALGKPKHHAIRRTRGDVVFDVINVFVVALITLTMIYPMWYIIIVSIATPEEAALALRHYRAYFVEKGMLENHLYDGIGELLAELKTSGKTLAVATSKPEPFAVKILEHFGIADCFAYIAGGTLDETRTKKAEVIRYALEMLGISPGLSVVMVGDRKYDIIGAREVGITSIGVLYGYGTRDELSEAGALLLAEDIGKLGTLLMPERALEA